jgi:NADH-quinone oxidoreductase subunit J
MSFVFWIIAALTLGGALLAVVLKNTVHCALALTVAFAGLAFLFLGLDAQFAGFTEILVYIGAVAILVVFAILLTRGSETPTGSVYSRYAASGLVASAAVFAALGWAVIQSAHALPNVQETPSATAQQIGISLVGRYVLPLEILAVLLTIATIGAVIVALHEKEAPKQ